MQSSQGSFILGVAKTKVRKLYIDLALRTLYSEGYLDKNLCELCVNLC